MAIQSFGDKATRQLFEKGTLKKGVPWQQVAKVAKRKLDMLDYAGKLSDLKVPPNNKLEALKHELKGFHSIRINDQWRIVFIWTDNGPMEVSIMDYH